MGKGSLPPPSSVPFNLPPLACSQPTIYALPLPPSSLLTTLRLDFSMGDWADALADATAMATEAAATARAADPLSAGGEGAVSAAATDGKVTDASGGSDSLTASAATIPAFASPSSGGLTPLAPLRHARSLLYLDLMLVDSGEGSAGLLDDRLIEDLAALGRLEEVRRWGERGGGGAKGGRGRGGQAGV